MLSFKLKRLKEEMPTALPDLHIRGFSYLVVVPGSPRLLGALPVEPAPRPVVPLEDILEPSPASQMSALSSNARS